MATRILVCFRFRSERFIIPYIRLVVCPTFSTFCTTSRELYISISTTSSHGNPKHWSVIRDPSQIEVATLDPQAPCIRTGRNVSRDSAHGSRKHHGR